MAVCQRGFVPLDVPTGVQHEFLVRRVVVVALQQAAVVSRGAYDGQFGDVCGQWQHTVVGQEDNASDGSTPGEMGVGRVGENQLHSGGVDVGRFEQAQAHFGGQHSADRGVNCRHPRPYPRRWLSSGALQNSPGREVPGQVRL